VVRRSRTESGPEALPIAFSYGNVVDACFPASHHAALVQLPHLITITAVPLAGIGVLLVREAHADSIVGTCPQSLHEADKQCTRPAHAAPPATPAPASPYELYNFRANHEPCANQGPERLRVVSRGLAHPPPCRHVGTCDHMSSPVWSKYSNSLSYGRFRPYHCSHFDLFSAPPSPHTQRHYGW